MTAPERVMIEGAALITGLPARTLQLMSQRGEIWSAAKLGRRWTYNEASLRAWLRSQEAANESRHTSISEAAFTMHVSPSMGGSNDNPLKRAIERKLKGVSTNG